MSDLEEFENYFTNFEKASIGRRLVASLIDFIIYYFVCVFLALVLDNSSESVFSFHLEGFSALMAFLESKSITQILKSVSVYAKYFPSGDQSGMK